MVKRQYLPILLKSHCLYLFFWQVLSVTLALSTCRCLQIYCDQNPASRQCDLIIRRAEQADFTIEQGSETMNSFLEEMGSDIKVLFAHNDDMALGAIEAMEAYGLKPGKDIVIISVDGTRKAFEMMVAGKINCIVECNPLLGPILMQAVKEVMDRRSLPKRIVP